MPTQKNSSQIQHRLETFVVELSETRRPRAAYFGIGTIFLVLTALAIYVMTAFPQTEIGF